MAPTPTIMIIIGLHKEAAFFASACIKNENELEGLLYIIGNNFFRDYALYSIYSCFNENNRIKSELSIIERLVERN
jgi:hypothetical protein